MLIGGCVVRVHKFLSHWKIRKKVFCLITLAVVAAKVSSTDIGELWAFSEPARVTTLIEVFFTLNRFDGIFKSFESNANWSHFPYTKLFYFSELAMKRGHLSCVTTGKIRECWIKSMLLYVALNQYFGKHEICVTLSDVLIERNPNDTNSLNLTIWVLVHLRIFPNR